MGSTSPVVEAELIGAVSEVLGRLGFDNYVIRLNHRELLRAILEVAGVPEALHGEALRGATGRDHTGDGRAHHDGGAGATAEQREAILLRWHREGFRLFRRFKTRARWGRPPLLPETVALIQQMATYKEETGMFYTGIVDRALRAYLSKEARKA
mgnify:CR=1 FL=1